MAQRERAVPVYRIEFDVGWPPGHVASYFIDCDEPALVDCGMPGPDGENRLREALSGVDHDLADVEHLVLTHPHVDHIGQANAVIEAANPTVYAPVGVRDRFARDPDDLRTAVRKNATAAGLAGEARDATIEMAVESRSYSRDLLPVGAVDVWVEGGRRYDVGGTPIETIHTPGHQADHCCFRVDLGTERALVAGDMAVEPFRSVALHVDLDHGVEDAIDAFDDALDRLSTLDPDRVYPGHGPIHADFERVVERDRRSLHRLLDRTVERLDDHHRTAAAVAEARTDGDESGHLLPEVVAALAHLDANDRVDSERVDGVARYYAG